MKTRLILRLCGLLVLIASTRAAPADDYTYDALQRLIRVDYDDGASIVYTYDAAGNRMAIAPKAAISVAVPGGGGTVTGSGLYIPGARVSMTAKPAAGYTFLRWEDGSQTATRTLVVPDASLALAAHFGLTANILPPVIGAPGARRALVGVAFSLPLDITSASLPTVTVTGLPAGLKYDPATTAITGVPTAAAAGTTVTIAAKNVNKTAATPQTFTLTVDPLPAWAQGSFRGWFERATDSGSLSADVTPQGKISGKVTLAGTDYTFSAPAYARRAADGVFWLSVQAKAGKAVLPLTLAVSNPVGAVPANLAVVDGWFAAVATGDPEAALYRNVWKDAGMTAVGAYYVGYYTAALPGSDSYGSGYLTFTVDKAGSVKTTGKLADGTVVSLSGTLLIDEAGHVFTVLYTAPATYQGGCLFGLAEFFRESPTAPVCVRLLEGLPFLWENRNPQATRHYAVGFNRELGLSGGWYDKVGNLYDYYRNRTLAVGTNGGAAAPTLQVGTGRYASVWWDPDGIALTPILSSSGVMTGIAAPAAGAPQKVGAVYDYDNVANTVGLTVALTRATGIFKGSFKAWFDYATTHTAKSIAVEGVLTPEREAKGVSVEGRGFFLWPDQAQYLNALGKPVSYTCNSSYDFLLLATP
jgi:YD repeat-containing protein